MDSPVTPLVASPVFPAALPGWSLPRGREPDDLAAGIALKSLDDRVRSAPSGPAAGGPARPSNVSPSRCG
jgi:hypothetical protein